VKKGSHRKNTILRKKKKKGVRGPREKRNPPHPEAGGGGTHGFLKGEEHAWIRTGPLRGTVKKKKKKKKGSQGGERDDQKKSHKCEETVQSTFPRGKEPNPVGEDPGKKKSPPFGELVKDRRRRDPFW